MNKIAIITVIAISLAFIGFGTFFSVANAITEIPAESSLDQVYTTVSTAEKVESDTPQTQEPVAVPGPVISAVRALNK